jgi:hypothetical protein
VLGEVGRLLVWMEFQPHAHNVCLVTSLVK